MTENETTAPSKVKAFAKKYWKHTAIGAGIALATAGAVYYRRSHAVFNAEEMEILLDLIPDVK